jgi:hypothetical protein
MTEDVTSILDKIAAEAAVRLLTRTVPSASLRQISMESLRCADFSPCWRRWRV